MEELFISASRRKLRFPYKGLISVEDLWDVPLTGLDAMFKQLNSELKETNEESLLGVKTTVNKELEIKIEIIKYIVNTKLAEQDEKSKAKEKREQKQKIMQILSSKENQELEGKSTEELRKMLEEL